MQAINSACFCHGFRSASQLVQAWVGALLASPAQWAEDGQMKKTLLCFGLGYSASALARLLKTAGWRVLGTTRDAAKASAFCREGIEALVWPGCDVAPIMAAASHILLSAGPTVQGDPVLGRVRGEFEARARELAWVGYLSTTGVLWQPQGGLGR